MKDQKELDGQIRLAGVIDYPGFEEARQGLKDRGKPYAWIDMVVDRNAPYSCFIKGGKPFYKCDCPHFEGYWLSGGLGSVQCSMVDHLIPGLHWDLTCRKDYENCPLRKGE